MNSTKNLFLCFFKNSDGEFMCYHCQVVAETPQILFDHSILAHDPEQQFSVRKKELDPETGRYVYISLHYGKKVCELKLTDAHIVANSESAAETKSGDQKPETVHEKDTSGDQKPETFNEKDTATRATEPQYETIKTIMSNLESIGRLDDFMELMAIIADGRLATDNIALHLLLDIGQFNI